MNYIHRFNPFGSQPAKQDDHAIAKAASQDSGDVNMRYKDTTSRRSKPEQEVRSADKDTNLAGRERNGKEQKHGKATGQGPIDHRASQDPHFKRNPERMGQKESPAQSDAKADKVAEREGHSKGQEGGKAAGSESGFQREPGESSQESQNDVRQAGDSTDAVGKLVKEKK